MALSNLQKQVANSIWDRLVSLIGFRDPGFKLSDLSAGAGGSLATTQALTLWVDAAAGDDTFDGSELRPFKSIVAALSSLPPIIKHAINIKVKAGTYSDGLQCSSIFTGDPSLGTLLTIEGVDFTTPVLGSGSITAGTLGTGVALPRPSHTPTAGAKCSYPVAGAAWAVNELLGMFVNIAGSLYPIAGNTATSVEIPVEGASINGKPFTIVQHGVVLSHTTGFAAVTSMTNAGRQNTALKLKNLKVQGSSFYGMYIDSGNVGLDGVLVKGHSFAGVIMYGTGSSLYCVRSFIHGPTYGIQTTAAVGYIGFSSSVVDGTGGGNRMFYGANTWTGHVDFLGHCIFQNAQFGFMAHAGPGFIQEGSTGHMIVRNCSVHGVNLSGGVNWACNPEVFNCVTGIKFRVAVEGELAGHINMNGTVYVNDCSGDALEVGGTHTALSFLAGDISGNTGTGIHMFLNAHNSFNSLSVENASTNFTMSANGSDVKYPGAGSGGVTLATLKTAGVTVDANSFTRINAS
jgi:hypothetical protein